MEGGRKELRQMYRHSSLFKLLYLKKKRKIEARLCPMNHISAVTTHDTLQPECAATERGPRPDQLPLHPGGEYLVIISGLMGSGVSLAAGTKTGPLAGKITGKLIGCTGRGRRNMFPYSALNVADERKYEQSCYDIMFPALRLGPKRNLNMLVFS